MAHLYSRQWLCLFLLLSVTAAGAQDSILQSGSTGEARALGHINRKLEKLNNQLARENENAITNFRKEEAKIYTSLLKTKDSVFAKAELKEVEAIYGKALFTLQNPASLVGEKASQYIPHLDTLKGILSLAGNQKGLANINALGDQFQQSEEIKRFIEQREEQLKNQLTRIGQLGKITGFSKQAWYYAASIRECKAIINDPAKIEKKAIAILSATKSFQDFMAKHSLLASLFSIPGGANEPSVAAATGSLQTRLDVSNWLNSLFGRDAPAIQQQLVQPAQSGLDPIQQLKDKIGSVAGSKSSNEPDPDFKPNDQHSKPFAKRLQYGFIFQTQKSALYFPNTAILGLSLGYKLNDKSLAGIGFNYQLGTGTGWKNIRFTNEGIGIRSFFDYRWKGNIFFSGGYEMNYREQFRRLATLYNISAWQQSGLVGLSRKYNVGKKLQEKMQFLWDFLSYIQVPKTQSIIFRIGYDFH